MKQTLRGAVIEDAYTLAPLLRQCDVDEIRAASGRDPLDSLGLAICSSTWSVTALGADGVPVAIFGVAPWGHSSDCGAPWMLATDALYKRENLRFMRRVQKAVVDRMNATFPILYNYVDVRNTYATLWLVKLGFQITGVYPEFGVARIPFYRFSRIAHV